MKLSDVFLRNLKGTGAVHSHADGGGLFIYVTETGKKFWRMAYRFAGKQKLLSFGEYPPITLREAREKREEAKKLLYDGIARAAIAKLDGDSHLVVHDKVFPKDMGRDENARTKAVSSLKATAKEIAKSKNLEMPNWDTR